MHFNKSYLKKFFLLKSKFPATSIATDELTQMN